MTGSPGTARRVGRRRPAPGLNLGKAWLQVHPSGGGDFRSQAPTTLPLETPKLGSFATQGSPRKPTAAGLVRSLSPFVTSTCLGPAPRTVVKAVSHEWVGGRLSCRLASAGRVTTQRQGAKTLKAKSEAGPLLLRTAGSGLPPWVSGLKQPRKSCSRFGATPGRPPVIFKCPSSCHRIPSPTDFPTPTTCCTDPFALHGGGQSYPMCCTLMSRGRRLPLSSSSPRAKRSAAWLRSPILRHGISDAKLQYN